MAKKYKALVGLTYPDKRSLAAVLEAGGMSKLSADERAKIKVKKVKAGTVCDDIPPDSVPWLLRQGKIEAVVAPKADTEGSRRDG